MAGSELVILSMVTSAIGTIQANKEASNQAKHQQQIADRNQALIKIQADRDEAARRSQTELDTASARARMGASGIANTGGSNQALLSGLRKNQNEDIAKIRFGAAVTQQDSQFNADKALSQAKTTKRSNNINLLANTVQGGFTVWNNEQKRKEEEQERERERERERDKDKTEAP